MSRPESVPALILHADTAAFLAAMSPFLETREAENGLPIGVLNGRLAADRAAAAKPGEEPLAPPFLAEWRLDRQTTAVAVYFGKLLILSHTVPPASNGSAPVTAASLQPYARELAAALNRRNLAIPGVIAPRLEAKIFAAEWTALRGCTQHLAMDQRIYQLTRVMHPAGVPGRMRQTTRDDLEAAAAWILSFAREAIPEETHTLEGCRENAIVRIGDSKLFFWEIDGQPVAMAALARESRHGITVNAVYTPPEHRRHGYATALVASVSAEGLRRGKSFCVLYTDLANPTSNSIYLKMGYRPVCDSQNIRFG